MDYEEFIKYFTHEISYNLKMLGVTWRASPVIGEGKEGAMAVIRGGGYRTDGRQGDACRI